MNDQVWHTVQMFGVLATLIAQQLTIYLLGKRLDAQRAVIVLLCAKLGAVGANYE